MQASIFENNNSQIISPAEVAAQNSELTISTSIESQNLDENGIFTITFRYIINNFSNQNVINLEVINDLSDFNNELNIVAIESLNLQINNNFDGMGSQQLIIQNQGIEAASFNEIFLTINFVPERGVTLQNRVSVIGDFEPSQDDDEEEEDTRNDDPGDLIENPNPVDQPREDEPDEDDNPNDDQDDDETEDGGGSGDENDDSTQPDENDNPDDGRDDGNNDDNQSPGDDREDGREDEDNNEDNSRLGDDDFIGIIIPADVSAPIQIDEDLPEELATTGFNLELSLIISLTLISATFLSNRVRN